MKNSMKNSLTGLSVMTIFQSLGFMKNKRVKNFLCSITALLLVAGFTVSAFAGGPHYVKNELELSTVLGYITSNPPVGSPGHNPVYASPNEVRLTDNILVQNAYNIDVRGGEELTIDLGRWNFQGNGIINFNQTGSGTATVNIIGSTIGFGDGMHLHSSSPDDLLKLNIFGIYTSSATDKIGDNVNDNIEVNITADNSAWDAFNHDLIIGNQGTAVFNISNGNEGKSDNVIIGNQATGSGTFDISGAGTVWTNTENIVVGAEGTGVLNLSDGALLTTGNFGVGTVSGTGTANIWGSGTILDIFGTNTGAATGHAGNGSLNVTDRAQVNLHYNDNLDNGTTLQGWANLDIGTGNSIFNNSYFNIDRGIVNAPANIIVFQNGAMFEGSTMGISKSSPAFSSIGTIDATLVFEDNAIFSPGYGSQTLWDRNAPVDFSQAGMVELYYLGKNAVPFDENGNRIVDRKGNPLAVGRYGQIDITNLDLQGNDDKSVSLWDFDVQGNQYHVSKSLEHQDYVNVSGTGTLGGHGHFRPMTGYYTDDINILFMAGNVTGDFAEMTLWPKRWFLDPEVVVDGAGAHLMMQRSDAPFVSSGNSYNEISVGAALDWIYNWRQGLNFTNDMTTQEKDFWFPVLDWFWGMGDEDFRQALRDASGEAKAASFLMPISSPWRFAFDRVNWRNCDNHVYFGPQNIYNPRVAKNDIWVNPYYDYRHTSSDENTSGSSVSRVSFVGGYDRALSRYTAVGFVFGYSQPKLDQGFSRILADDYLFGLHFNTRFWDDYELKVWGGYGCQNYRLHRSIPIRGGSDVHAGYSGNTWTGSIQVSTPFSRKYGVIRPLVALDYSYVEQGEATEQGYAPIALNYESSSQNQLFARTGVRGDFGWKRFNFTSSVALSYQVYGDTYAETVNRFQIGGPEFGVRGVDPSRTFVSIGLGTQVYLNRLKSRMLFVQYNGDYGRRSNIQTANLGYQMTF